MPPSDQRGFSTDFIINLYNDGLIGNIARIRLADCSPVRLSLFVTVVDMRCGVDELFVPVRPGHFDAGAVTVCHHCILLNSYRSEVFSSCRSRMIPMLARFAPASTSSRTRRRRAISSRLNRRVPPSLRIGVTRPRASYCRNDCTPTPVTSATSEIENKRPPDPGSTISPSPLLPP